MSKIPGGEGWEWAPRCSGTIALRSTGGSGWPPGPPPAWRGHVTRLQPAARLRHLRVDHRASLGRTSRSGCLPQGPSRLPRVIPGVRASCRFPDHTEQRRGRPPMRTLSLRGDPGPFGTHKARRDRRLCSAWDQTGEGCQAAVHRDFYTGPANSAGISDDILTAPPWFPQKP